MITGTVNAKKEAIIPLKVHLLDGTEREVPFIVDTGYDGWLTLPQELIEELGLVSKDTATGFLADGTEIKFDIYELKVIWDGIRRTVPLYALDVPLMGMSLISGYELNIQARDGGTVTLQLL